MNDENLFHLALQRPAGERSAFLDRECAGDVALRRRMEILLKSHETPDSFLERPAADPGVIAELDQVLTTNAGPTRPDVEILDRKSPTEGPGGQIGPYKLLQQIGEGGMGTVYMAEQTQPVRRKVALKVIKPGMDSRQVIARFEAERQALAIMDHVNIARVFDAGATDAGRPYFVMELVHGVPITNYCDDNHLTPRQRLELFVPVCRAIQHAHQKGIIHRDIKPSNVMITLYDGKPVPKVIDFGVAKATEQKLTEQTLFTHYGTLVGTLEYMSPEQAEMSALGVDTRSDIYSLGVLLYELLTGSTPLSHKRVKEVAFNEILRLIREEEPPRPSTRLSDSGEALASISAQRHMEPARLTKLVRGELDWIVMKTLEKDRNRRYETASGFAADVQRYLDDEPVQACPPSTIYRLRKFSRRNKRSLTTLALLGVMMLMGAVLLVVNNVQLKEEQTRTDAQRNRAETALGKAKENLELADENLGLALEALDEVYIKEIEERVHLKRDLKRDLTSADREFLQKGLRFYEQFGKRNSAHAGLWGATAKADRRAGSLLLELKQWEEAGAHFRKAIPQLEKLAAQSPTTIAFRRELASTRDGLSVALRNTGPLEEAETTCRQAIALWQELKIESPTERNYRVWLGESLWHLQEILTVKGRFQDAEASARQALKVFEQLRLEGPEEKFFRQQAAYSHRHLADNLRSQGRLQQAVESYQRSVDTFAALVAESTSSFHWQSELAGTHDSLARALNEGGQPQESEAAYRKAISLNEKLVEEAPKDVNYRQQAAYSHRNLADNLWSQGRLPQAVESYQRSVALFAGLVAESPSSFHWQSELARTHDTLGQALNAVGQTQESETAYRQAISLNEKLVKEAPKDVTYRKGLALSLGELAQLVWAAGRLPEAEGYYRQALLHYEELVAQDRAEPEYWYLLARQHHGMARLVQAAGRSGEVKPTFEQSLHAYREAVTRYERRAAVSPSEATRWQLADCYGWMAEALRESSQPKEAIKAWRQSVSIHTKLVDEFGLAKHGRLLALGHHHLGELFNEIGRLQDSEGAYSDALAVWKKLIATDSRPEYRSSLAATQGQIAEVQAQRKLDKDIAICRQAIKLNPKSAKGPTDLGNALLAQKRRDEAIAAYLMAIEIDPKYVRARTNLAVALRAQGKLDEAIACCRKAIEIDPKYVPAYNNLGSALVAQGKLDEATVSFRRSIEIDPKSVLPGQVLGYPLGSKAWHLANCPDPKFRDIPRAIESTRELVELAPQSGLAWQYLGWVQYRAGDWKASLEALEKSCKLQAGGKGDCGQWFVMSLAHWKLATETALPEQERDRHRTEARRRYEQADELINSWWRVRPRHETGQDIWDFRAEARDLLNPKEIKK